MTRLEITIVWILEKARECKIPNLSALQIHKLVYLIDVEARKFVGGSFYDSMPVFHRDKLGPISKDVYNALDGLKKSKVVTFEVEEGRDYVRHCYRINDRISLNKLAEIRLSDGEMAFLGSVIDDYIILKQNKLKEVAYATEPMTEISSREKDGKILKGELLNMNLISLDDTLLEAISEY